MPEAERRERTPDHPAGVVVFVGCQPARTTTVPHSAVVVVVVVTRAANTMPSS
jgi:hypothetical protein